MSQEMRQNWHASYGSIDIQKNRCYGVWKLSRNKSDETCNDVPGESGGRKLRGIVDIDGMQFGFMKGKGICHMNCKADRRENDGVKEHFFLWIWRKHVGA